MFSVYTSNLRNNTKFSEKREHYCTQAGTCRHADTKKQQIKSDRSINSVMR